MTIAVKTEELLNLTQETLSVTLEIQSVLLNAPVNFSSLDALYAKRLELLQNIQTLTKELGALEAASTTTTEASPNAGSEDDAESEDNSAPIAPAPEAELMEQFSYSHEKVYSEEYGYSPLASWYTTREEAEAVRKDDLRWRFGTFLISRNVSKGYRLDPSPRADCF